MTNYIDGFVLPVPRNQLKIYREVVEKVAEIWKEYGALEYSEYVIDDSNLEGTRPFSDTINAKEDEAIIFGWVLFPSKETRDLANKQVPKDPRMAELVAPLTDPESLIFDAERMVYGGFQSFVQSSKSSSQNTV